ncbi:MAG: hypothetical protein IPH46_07700 [Bacteroidetes bacterium]|nr:hypothetical protein [Bacteroidota bacterium]
MITKIILDNAIKEHFKAEGEDNCLNNLNQLNILIGANNTGKSRFLRTLFTNRNFKLEITELKAREISDLFRIIKDEISSSIDRMGYDDVNSQNIQGVKKTLKST